MNEANRLPAPLSLAGLNAIPEAAGKPVYRREDLTPGIVHFGPGNFHRAHQGFYLNSLMNLGQDKDWGIVGVSVMPADEKLRQALLKQDLLSTIVVQSASESDAFVSGSMLAYESVADFSAILNALTDSRIRIVSLTVTEGGYFIDSASGGIDIAHPAIQQDLANRESPKTVFGLIVRALELRRQAGVAPFTVMSCDNLPHNGVITSKAVLGLAKGLDPELAQWIEANVSFPNGMVDRIAPATGPREHALIRDEHGIDDSAPVFCEDYIQWVLEDKFVAGRPAFEKVGVQFVDDVTPYETMKVRILNGGHAVIAYAAALLEIEYCSQAMQDPDVLAFLDKVERLEILPIVPPVPNTDLSAYLDLIKTRFANPNIGDTVHRLCLDGSNRQPKFIIPSVRDQIAKAGNIRGLALASALWCRYCFGTTDSGARTEPGDPSWQQLNETAIAAKSRPAAWLEMQDIYGDLALDQRFSKCFSEALTMLWRDGTRKTLQHYLQS